MPVILRQSYLNRQPFNLANKKRPSLDGPETSLRVLVKDESVEKPLFVVANWTTQFLPTLYHFLFCSEKPFHKFSRGSGFVAIFVQNILNLVHPGNTYVVTNVCNIYTSVSVFFCLIHSLIILNT